MLNTCLSVKVVPNSAKDDIVGWLDGRLKIKVGAPPEKGRANKAVVKLLAKSLGVAKKDVRLVSGDTNSLKVFEFSGISHEQLHQRLDELLN